MLQISNKDNIDNASIQDMIGLLKEYEKMCLDKQDFSSADQAKHKIDFLKSQEIILRKEKMDNEDKQNIENISKQGEEEVKLFQEYWDEQLKQLLDALKEVQANLIEQHQQQLVSIQGKLMKEDPPRIKYSSQVLELRKYLSSLIRIKNYKEAEIVKGKLENKEKEEEDKWVEKHQTRQKGKLEIVKKKQNNQLKALRVRLEAAFNEKIKERDQKFETLLKKNRKRRIESGKVSRERLQTKTALLNESKTYMTMSKY